MESNEVKFLNLIVQNVHSSSIQKFMQEWVKQVCKDFRIVFFDQDIDFSSTPRRTALEYAVEFSNALDLKDLVQIVKSDDQILKAHTSKTLESTTCLPKDKFEVLKLKQKFQIQQEAMKQMKASGLESLSCFFNEFEDLAEVQLDSKAKLVCYTCIVNDYDCLRAPLERSQNVDYICFTDNLKMPANGWELRAIPQDLLALPKVKQQRILKILPQKYLEDYDASLWVDSNIQIVRDVFKNVFKRYDLSKASLYTSKHPHRNCIYDEQLACIKLRKDTLAATYNQIDRYRREKFPKNIGLAETGLILRDHHDEACLNTMNIWAEEVKVGSHRDQLSFNYACWKTGFNYGLLKETVRSKTNDQTFFLFKHKSKQTYVIERTVTFAIVNYNTPILTNALVRSIQKHVKDIGYEIVVLDNSDQEKFIQHSSKVKVLDNTENKLIDFQKLIQKHSTVESGNNYASLKHALSIQYLLDNIQSDDMILLDSDVLLKRNIDFIDHYYVTIAQVQDTKWKRRFAPYIQYFNVKKIRECGLRYLDLNRMHGGSNKENSKRYDTGASFYEDVAARKLPFRTIPANTYIVHLGSGSWKNVNYKKFLTNNKHLWI